MPRMGTPLCPRYNPPVHDRPAPAAMTPDRLAGFTDGVLAIVITIAVLELRVPESATLAGLSADLPILATYAVSFFALAVYWNNHHHLFQLTESIDGRVLWANLFALFWLSLVPFDVRWINAAGLEPLPVAGFGLILGMASLGYLLTEHAITRCAESNQGVRRAVGGETKGRVTMAAQFACAALAFWLPLVAVAGYVVVLLVWVVPDRRIEAELAK